MPERRKKMKDFVEMKRKEQEAFLMSPILNELKNWAVKLRQRSFARRL